LGRRPALTLELTNKCPLSCPGCYAYQPAHVLGRPLELIHEYKGDELVAGVLALLEERRPLGLFLVGGEPLVRIRELRALLPEICGRGIEVEVVTSGIVRIPSEWRQLKGLVGQRGPQPRLGTEGECRGSMRIETKTTDTNTTIGGHPSGSVEVLTLILFLFCCMLEQR
jgi:hypothetical protein